MNLAVTGGRGLFTEVAGAPRTEPFFAGVVLIRGALLTAAPAHFPVVGLVR